MPCNVRRELQSRVDSTAYHLQMRLVENETDDLRFELVDLKQMAQSLLDALNRLKEHGEDHHCRAKRESS